MKNSLNKLDVEDMLTVKRKRAEFNKWKLTADYEQWRTYAYRVQRNKCAWCLYKFKPYSKIHVDHCLALYHGGSNKKFNLVLAHAHCNVEKWIRIDGVPQWIKNRRRIVYLQDLRKRQKKQYKLVMKEIEQEQIASSLSWIKE